MCECNYEFLIPYRSTGESATKDVEGYLKDLIFMGRVYDYEIENEHLMTAFQQFLDQSSNNTKAFDFSSVIAKVRSNGIDLFILEIGNIDRGCARSRNGRLRE